jgi:acyl carrier protein
VRNRGIEMQNVQKWIAEILMCTPESLPSEHTPLHEIEGWDSLKHVSLVVGLERRLNARLTAEQIRGIVTLGDVAGILRHNVADA